MPIEGGSLRVVAGAALAAEAAGALAVAVAETSLGTGPGQDGLEVFEARSVETAAGLDLLVSGPAFLVAWEMGAISPLNCLTLRASGCTVCQIKRATKKAIARCTLLTHKGEPQNFVQADAKVRASARPKRAFILPFVLETGKLPNI